MEQMTKKNCQNRIRVVLADKQITNRWLADRMGGGRHQYDRLTLENQQDTALHSSIRGNLSTSPSGY